MHNPHFIGLHISFPTNIKNVTASKIPWLNNIGQDPDLQVASLPEGSQWLTLPSSHLFVRKHYDHLWGFIKEAYLNRMKLPPELAFQRVLLFGNSGIGKTGIFTRAKYSCITNPNSIPKLFSSASAPG